MTVSYSIPGCSWFRRPVLMALVAGLIFAVPGCGQDNRPLSYEKGTYGGAVDEKLDDDVIRALEQRTNYQRSTF